MRKSGQKIFCVIGAAIFNRSYSSGAGIESMWLYIYFYLRASGYVRGTVGIITAGFHSWANSIKGSISRWGLYMYMFTSVVSLCPARMGTRCRSRCLKVQSHEFDNSHKMFVVFVWFWPKLTENNVWFAHQTLRETKVWFFWMGVKSRISPTECISLEEKRSPCEHFCRLVDCSLQMLHLRVIRFHWNTLMLSWNETLRNPTTWTNIFSFSHLTSAVLIFNWSFQIRCFLSGCSTFFLPAILRVFRFFRFIPKRTNRKEHEPFLFFGDIQFFLVLQKSWNCTVLHKNIHTKKQWTFKIGQVDASNKSQLAQVLFKNSYIL